MIKEDYVSLETAKLLKEKGFNEEVKTFYSYDSEFKIYDFQEDDRWDMPNNWGEYYWSVPTLQMAMKWLREVHNRHISIEHSYVLNKYRICITKYNPNNISDLNNTLYFSAGYDFSVYEQACEEAIKYCLKNLI